MTLIDIDCSPLTSVPADAVIIPHTVLDSWLDDTDTGRVLSWFARRSFKVSRDLMPRLDDGEAWLLRPDQKPYFTAFRAILVVKDNGYESLEDLLAAAFAVVDKFGLEHVAMPLLRSGVNPYDPMQSPDSVMIQTCRFVRDLHLADPPHPQRLTIAAEESIEEMTLYKHLSGITT